MKSTNYYDTFIIVADGCPVEIAEVLPERSRKTKVSMLRKMIA